MNNSFKDELNKSTKTQQQIIDEHKEFIKAQAELEYEFIKKEFLYKAESVDYSIRDGKKHIFVEHEFKFYKDFILRDNKTTRSKKIFGSGYNIYTNIKYSIKNNEEYRLFMNTLNSLAREDGMDIVPVFLSVVFTEKTPISLPYTYTGQYSIAHKIEGHLCCSVEY